MFENLLVYISALPVLGILLLMFIPSKNSKLLKITALNFSSLPFLGFLLVWVYFKNSIAQFQFVTKIYWMPFLNLNLTLGVDGISLFFLLLTTLLIPICILISWSSVKKGFKRIFNRIFIVRILFNWCFLYFRSVIILYFF